MTPADAAQAAGYAATVCGEIQSALATEPLPLHEIATRTGRPVALVAAMLNLLRHRGLVDSEPGPDRGVFVWRRTR